MTTDPTQRQKNALDKTVAFEQAFEESLKSNNFI